MAGSAMSSVREPDRYHPPALTGLVDLLDGPVRARPDARALVAGAERAEVTYAALAALADTLAGRLTAAGLRPGDRVGLAARNTVEFVVALLGAARAGAVVAPLDPALPPGELAARLATAGARVALYGEGPPADVPAWRVRVPGDPGAVVLDTAPAPLGPPRPAPPELGPDDALIMSTSGTTDRARLVPLTHANVAAAVRGLCTAYELGPRDATVAVMPLFHTHGLIAALLATLAGGGCVLLPAGGRFAAGRFWDDMRAVRASWFTAAPAIHEVLLDRSADEHPEPLPSLRFARSSSAPLNTATQRALERTLGVPLLSAYGLTEASHQGSSETLPPGKTSEHGSVGRPAGMLIRIADPAGRECPPGLRGEVWMRGPAVARGYLDDPAATARAFRGGWLRTGDLGHLDADGVLFLGGRIRNLIAHAGDQVSPEYVEDVLRGFPAVAEAAVFGVPDVGGGHRVGAAVVLCEGEEAEPAQIIEYCRDRLAAFAVPGRVEVVAALPYTAKGVLDRQAVRLRFGR
ncbi:putative sulfoacetate--CoA ligase [Streptomyces sp. RB5]|uniref:Putative sulfoacetate--CoA ligase n=1 Tax=Streptomyces smaragdinus TaxID=2585196 RepID=A0A7K0CB03_9ACTN|nr:FadD7 family fatty acid--CoA ligase [Streptomyces smaragdinus]MQY10637.1 putative sulfoacetate--CoA ligase [Streptomyces smaragdinus]